jgi:hypothetical protein
MRSRNLEKKKKPPGGGLLEQHDDDGAHGEDNPRGANHQAEKAIVIHFTPSLFHPPSASSPNSGA